MEIPKLESFVKNRTLKAVIEKTIVIYCGLFLSISVLAVLPLYSMVGPKIPTFFLVIRELLFFLTLSIFVLLSSKKWFLGVSFVILATLFLQLVVTSGFSLLIVLGFKSLLPLIFLFSVPLENGFKINKNTLIKLVKILFFINFAFQLIHLFFANGYYARYGFGLNSRNPGLFYFPAASAFFSTILFCIFAKSREKLNLKEVSLFLISVGLCASLTGMAGACLIVILNFKKMNRKNFMVSWLWIVISFINLHFARMAMTGSTYLNETAGGRLEIFEKTYSKMQLRPENFGLYTNAASNYSHGFIADSSFSAILGNLGVAWSIVFGIFFLILFWINLKKNRDVQILLVVVLCAFGLNVTETGISIFLAIIARYVFVQQDDSLPSQI